MKRALALLALLSSVPAFAAAPPIDFSTIGTASTFNSVVHNTWTVDGITIDAFKYAATPTYTASKLWLRTEAVPERGLGVCSEGSLCGPAAGPGYGDYNELSNERNDEVIRLTRPDNTVWSDLWVSSLDSGGTNNNEKGIVYSSDLATPVLSGGASFSHSALGADDGSIWSLVSAGIDPTDKYLFLRADPTNTVWGKGNNDYLVWGVGVLPIPEPETYAMLLAGLALLGLAARRSNLGRLAA
ncbi:MAG TPA: PEP-CTERM sorting domain-containing protein [Burkholderiales bacterium]|nr:PEP-CTERM sorting domain-containing protein [Burkholderiales bacterium]